MAGCMNKPVHCLKKGKLVALLGGDHSTPLVITKPRRRKLWRLWCFTGGCTLRFAQRLYGLLNIPMHRLCLMLWRKLKYKQIGAGRYT